MLHLMLRMVPKGRVMVINVRNGPFYNTSGIFMSLWLFQILVSMLKPLAKTNAKPLRQKNANESSDLNEALTIGGIVLWTGAPLRYSVGVPWHSKWVESFG
jgi:hypothetical protein